MQKSDSTQDKQGVDIAERLKRFNDVYTLLFVVITILLTVGASTVQIENLAATITFSLGSLAAWVFGHLAGAKSSLRHVEIQLKMIAWLYASLVASDVILKFALHTTNLSDFWSAVCIFASVSSGLGLFFFLRKGVHRRDERQFALMVALLAVALILYVIYARSVVF